MALWILVSPQGQPHPEGSLGSPVKSRPSGPTQDVGSGLPRAYFLPEFWPRSPPDAQELASVGMPRLATWRRSRLKENSLVQEEEMGGKRKHSMASEFPNQAQVSKPYTKQKPSGAQKCLSASLQTSVMEDKSHKSQFPARALWPQQAPSLRMEAQRKCRPRKGRLKEVEPLGSSAPWKLSLKNRGGGSDKVSALPTVHGGRGRASFFQHGRSSSGTEAGALRIELKGVILACSFVRIGSKQSLEKEYCSWKSRSLSCLLRRLKENMSAQLLNFAWKAKKKLGTRGTNNTSAQGKDLW